MQCIRLSVEQQTLEFGYSNVVMRLYSITHLNVYEMLKIEEGAWNDQQHTL